MSSRPKVLVTSAAGKTGLQTALQLLDHGYPVRAFLRRLDHRSDRLKQAGAEIFVGNQYSLSDMRKAMDGARRAYQCAPTAPNGLHFNAVFTAAAAQSGIDHVVTLSQWLSSEDHPSLFTREVYISDILIRMRPGMTVTTVNVGWFADNYLMVLNMASQLGILPMPLGDGDTKGNAPPSNADIASVVAAALMDPDTHAGKTYRPTGPELLSPNEIAAATGRALGRPVRYMNISEAMFLKALKAVPPPNYSDAALSQLRIYAEEYRRGAFAINAPNDHVEIVTGRVPESFETVVRNRLQEHPDLTPRLSRKVLAMLGFIRIVLTRKPDTKAIETARDYVQLSAARYCGDDPGWRATHHPKPTRKATGKAAK